MSPPKVTVYITNYNYGKYLPQAIDSVLGQTMQDFELIIIDDGSNDNSRDVIERYAAKSNIIPIFQQNRGLNVTNNIALHAARGKYIMRLDADDWLDKHALQILTSVLDQDQRVGLVFPDYYIVDEFGNIIEHVRRHNFREVKLFDQPAHGACTLIRRDCLLALDGYDESFRCQDGFDLWVRFVRRYAVQNVNLPLFFYRRHTANLTRNEEHVLHTRNEIIRRASERLRSEEAYEPNTVVIIPVRGTNIDPNSFPLRRLGDKPLLFWTIDAALSARRKKSVIVTSPDTALLDTVSATYGEQVYCVLRDRSLAMHNTYLEETLRHALREAAAPDPEGLVAVLQFECPFRLGRHIDSAIDVLRLFDTDTVIAVRPEASNYYRHEGNGLVPLRSSQMLRLERDDLFREVGALRVVRRRLLEAPDGRIISGRIGHLVLEQRAAFEIQSEWDWSIAEYIATRQYETDA